MEKEKLRFCHTAAPVFIDWDRSWIVWPIGAILFAAIWIAGGKISEKEKS